MSRRSTPSAVGNAQLDGVIRSVVLSDGLRTPDAIVDAVRAKAPRYQRTAQNALRKKAEQVLRELADQLPPPTPSPAPSRAAAEDAPERGHNVLNESLYGGRGAVAAATASSSGSAAKAGAEDDAASDGSASRKRTRARKVDATRRRRARVRKEADGGASGTAEVDAAIERNALDRARAAFSARPAARLADLAGIDDAVRAMRELVEWPLLRPEPYAVVNVEPPRGVLLHGPPGCGKTLLANAIAGELGDIISFHAISAPEVVSGMSGESEGRLRQLFESAKANAPALIFIDEIDVIASKTESTARAMDRRIVAQLKTCMDGLGLDATGGKPVVVIAATNRPDAIDSALRRSGRFDREVCLPIPDVAARQRILTRFCATMRLSGEIDLAAIARATPGYVGADLSALTKEAALVAVHRVFAAMPVAPVEAEADAEAEAEAEAEGGEEEDDVEAASTTTGAAAAADGDSHLQVSTRLRDTGPLSEEEMAGLRVTEADFQTALKRVQPSAMREGFATIPDVSWDDVGALDELHEALEMSIVVPIRQPEEYDRLGLTVPAGVLLYGPPGCGKTLLAKAIANESGANFISVKGPELLDKYVGESERAVRQVFTRARASSPCVVFFDELDALAPRRGFGGGGGGGVSERVVNQLLTELDGVEARRDVFIVAATNRPDIIDPAMIRPGRLEKLLYVPLPTAEGRAAILAKHLRRTPIDPSVRVEAIASDARCECFSGADLAGLVREAALSALRDRMERRRAAAAGGAGGGGGADDDDVKVTMQHFARAFSVVRPSVSKEDQRGYEAVRDHLQQARSHVRAADGAGDGADASGDAAE